MKFIQIQLRLWSIEPLSKLSCEEWGIFVMSSKRSDLGMIVRGKYADRIKEESNVVLLGPDIAQAFSNDKAVNNALRSLLKLAAASRRLTKQSKMQQ